MRFDQLAAQLQGLTEHIYARFNAMDDRLNGFDGRFNLIDEVLATILSRLGNR